MAELVGTALMILLGNGVVANVLLPRTKGTRGGWKPVRFNVHELCQLHTYMHTSIQTYAYDAKIKHWCRKLNHSG